MPEWLIERGIGETRAVRIEQGEIVEARIFLEHVVRAGETLRARLKQAGVPAVAEADGQEYLLPKGATGTTEGATVTIEVTREAIPGAEPWKRPLARVAADEAPCVERVEGEPVRFPAPDDRLGDAGWDDLLEEARSGIVRFAGGELRVSPTPAMTLVDVDGRLPPLDLALAGVKAAARMILRHGVGGSIGIDFPTVSRRADRQVIGRELDRLLPHPFERTAVNGFGFLQLVRPRRHASLFELAADRAPFEARSLLRRVALEKPGSRRLVTHPAVIAVLERRSDWLDQLSRQIGGAVTLRSEPLLPIDGAYAESA